MVRNEFTFPSADGKTAIHAAEWLPETAPRAVLVLSHGVSEHILRYEPFAAFLTERGFAFLSRKYAHSPSRKNTKTFTSAMSTVSHLNDGVALTVVADSPSTGLFI